MKTKILLTVTFLLWQAWAWGQATLVKDIYPLKGGGIASGSYFPASTISSGNTLYFGADNSVNGNELWKSDGTEQGTVMIKDINQGSRFESSSPGSFFIHKDAVIFRVYDPNTVQALYRTNGTENGTFSIWSEKEVQYSQVFNIDTSYFFQTSTAIIRKSFNDKTYKTLINASTSKKLYQGIGSPFSPFSNNIYSPITILGNKWLFVAIDSNGLKSLFISDETENGTKILRNLNIYDQFYGVKSNQKFDIAFFGHDDGSNGRELWKTDGTQNGTKLIKNLAPGGLSSIDPGWQFDITIIKNGAIFTANDGVNGRELWFSDGTETGTAMIKDLTAGSGGTSFSKFFKSETDENVIYFTINANELWKTDGTAQGTVLVMKASTGFALQDRYATSTTYFEQSGGFLYFLTNSSTGYGYDIWRSNGTLEGNVKLGTISNCESAPYFRIAGKNLFYAGSDAQTGIELWKFPLCSHTAKINTPNGTSFCPGSSVSITGEGNGATSPFTYKWKQGTTDAGIAATLAVTRAGTYTVEVTDKEGCTVSASVDITQTTNLPVSITGANSFCTGQTTTLTANATGGVSPYTYQWKQNSVNVGTNAITYAASAAGSYNVAVTDSKGCTGTSAAYSVTQKPSPNVTVSSSRTPTLLTGESVVLSVPTAAGQTYQWAKDGVAISGATNNSYTVSGAGSYTVAVTGSGCTATSSAVMVSIILANEPLAEEIGLRVSPNPAINQAKIVLQLAQSASANVYVLDASGRRVRTWESGGKATRHEVMLDMRSVAAGNYVVQAEAEGQVFTEKLVKQ